MGGLGGRGRDWGGDEDSQRPSQLVRSYIHRMWLRLNGPSGEVTKQRPLGRVDQSGVHDHNSATLPQSLDDQTPKAAKRSAVSALLYLVDLKDAKGKEVLSPCSIDRRTDGDGGVFWLVHHLMKRCIYTAPRTV